MARLQLNLDLDAGDVATLRGAAIAAKATELAEIHRRTNRLSFGYGTESARDGMTDEVAQHRRRIQLLDELLLAIERARSA